LIPSVGGDTFRALHILPGVASDGVSAMHRIRGGDSNEVLYRLDGVDLYQPFHFSGESMEEVAEFTHEIMMSMARMLPPELRGHYSEDSVPASPSSQDSSHDGGLLEEGIETSQ